MGIVKHMNLHTLIKHILMKNRHDIRICGAIDKQLFLCGFIYSEETDQVFMT